MIAPQAILGLRRNKETGTLDPLITVQSYSERDGSVKILTLTAH